MHALKITFKDMKLNRQHHKKCKFKGKVSETPGKKGLRKGLSILSYIGQDFSKKLAKLIGGDLNRWLLLKKKKVYKCAKKKWARNKSNPFRKKTLQLNIKILTFDAEESRETKVLIKMQLA